jgi:cellulose synthase/poly-beta-1,6-N-acetylglucosamine synthase-like glycosyltransferase
MTLAAIAAGLAWFSIAGCAVLFGFMAATFYLLWLHRTRRVRGMADEAAALAAPLPADETLPDIVVQIPIFNEGVMVRRAARAAAALEWPRAKLHIQFLDDSTDDTPEHSRAAAAELRAAGLDAEVLHRTERTDFKAGALRDGVARVPHLYFAIFDVDYVPPPDFLRRAMRPLLADPKLAFVQGRYDFLNPAENRLTEIQVVLQDAHLGVEQATRSWAGHPLPFNGTCGIWRRAAIDEAGGWRGESLAEDLDLSYRAWLKGWRGRFLVTVSAPGELPATLKTWIQQQRRWTKGFGQVARRMMPILATRRGLSAKARLDSFLHLVSWFSLPLSNATVYAGVAALILDGRWLASLGPLLILLIASGYVTMYAFLRTGNRFIRGDSWSRGRFLRVFLRIVAIGFYAGFAQTRAYWDALTGRKSAFVRTPKRGAAERS